MILVLTISIIIFGGTVLAVGIGIGMWIQNKKKEENNAPSEPDPITSPRIEPETEFFLLPKREEKKPAGMTWHELAERGTVRALGLRKNDIEVVQMLLDPGEGEGWTMMFRIDGLHKGFGGVVVKEINGIVYVSVSYGMDAASTHEVERYTKAELLN